MKNDNSTLTNRNIIKSLISRYPSDDIREHQKEIIKIINKIICVVKKHKYSFVDEITDVSIPISDINDWIFIKNILMNQKTEIRKLIRTSIYKLTNYGMSIRYNITDTHIHFMLILMYDDTGNKNFVIY